MLITRETDYALRILRALDLEHLKKTAELSRQECVPKEFTYKIIKKLEKANMVQIRSGNGGGCRLIGELDRFSLYDLIHAMGDSFMVNACLGSGYHCSWEQNHGCCQTHVSLLALQNQIEDQLKAITLDQLCTKKIS